MAYLNTLDLSDSTSTLITIALTAISTIILSRLLQTVLFSPPRPSIIPSPLQTTIPRLSPAQLSALDYHPTTSIPGSRDIPSPYGSIRAYEFGDPEGRKTLLVHGITTTCQTLFPLASHLASPAGGNRRVLLFDLFGRGFSDGVGDLPHDARLYTSQILAVLASSPLSWTGGSSSSSSSSLSPSDDDDDEATGFDLVGYSMGGGVAVHFAASFPNLVRTLVLLAPAGMIRAESFGRVAKWIFRSGYVPQGILGMIARRRLRKPLSAAAAKRPKAVVHEGDPAEGVAVPPSLKGDPVELAAAEIPSSPPLNVRVLRYVQWMLRHHEGFLPAFTSCVRDAPLMGQDEVYKTIGEQRKAGTTCVILARSDGVISWEDYTADVLPLLGGKEKVTWRIVPGGHDFPMTYTREVVEVMTEFWTT